MGPVQVEAASMFHSGKKKGFIVHDKKVFNYSSLVNTNNAHDEITDSAASGTAIATMTKTSNKSIAVDVEGNKLDSILKHYQSCGFQTGVVTSSYVLDATPAAFYAHSTSRKDQKRIQKSLFKNMPNVVFGGGKYFNHKKEHLKDIPLIKTRAELMGLKSPYPKHILGLFNEDKMSYETAKPKTEPTLLDLTAVALNILKDKSTPYFLLIEGGRIDHAGHANDLRNNLVETVRFMESVKLVSSVLEHTDNSLQIVTADHETGGLTVKKYKKKGKLPHATFQTMRHTDTKVPLWISMKNIKDLQISDNTAVISPLLSK